MQISSTGTVDVLRRATVNEIEALLLQPNLSKARTLRIPNDFDGDLLADVWAALLIGTITKRATKGLTAVTWGLSAADSISPFIESLAGIVALQLCESVESVDRDATLSLPTVEYQISVAQKGLLESSISSRRTLVEFDPQHPRALMLRGATRADRATMFRAMIRRFQASLQVDAQRHSIDIQDAGAIGVLTDIMGELYENSYLYATPKRDLFIDDRSIRFIRFRRHVANSYKELQGRIAEDSPVHRYLTDILFRDKGGGSRGLMEATVSDFGPGIVDHFVHSEKGRSFTRVKRRELLDNLVHGSLSSSSDPAAGRGIPKALAAATSLGAFVSLRTNEFWISKSYGRSDSAGHLEDTTRAALAPVVGTHWQFLWPMGI